VTRLDTSTNTPTSTSLPALVDPLPVVLPTPNSYGATDSYPDLEETKSRKGTGGIGGIVSSSNKSGG
jgi:hypothetical protein